MMMMRMVVVMGAVFALSGIASQNAMQIDSSCDSKCHIRRIHVQHKINHKCFDSGITGGTAPCDTL